MRYQQFLDVAQCPTLPAFQHGLETFAAELDFGLYSAALVVPRPGHAAVFFSITNAPEDYQELFKDEQASQRDPVLAHLKRTSVPIIYTQDTYVATKNADLWEEQAAFGFRTGISVALHLPDHTHFLLGIDRSAPLPDDDRALTQVFAHLQLMAVHAQHAATRLLRSADGDAEHGPPLFTTRELECLRWTMAGKTGWEIGKILGISEKTTQFHLRNAMVKTGATSKHQAVLTALKWALI
jgi:DNA-binding CsgD family transcriptional regulator